MRWFIQYKAKTPTGEEWLSISEYEYSNTEVDTALNEMKRKFPTYYWRKEPVPDQQLFSIYTNRSGHQILGFRPEDGDCFQQAREYAARTFNDPNDPPSFYRLVPCPVNWGEPVKSVPITPSYSEMDYCPICQEVHAGACRK